MSPGLNVFGCALAFLLSARADAEVGVSDDKIKIGTTLALTGSSGEQGNFIREGAQLYWNKVNKEGGVHGRRVETVFLDDGFVPLRAVENVKKLIEAENVFAMLTNLGTPTSK